MIQLLHQKKIEIAQKMHCVFQVSYAVEAKLLGAEEFFPPLKRTVADLQKSDTQFYGYWKQHSLAAVIELKKEPTSTHVQSLIVDPLYFRQGIGRKLLEFAERIASGVITVETGLANAPACALYENFGFVKEKTYLTDVGIEKIRFRLDKPQTS